MSMPLPLRATTLLLHLAPLLMVGLFTLCGSETICVQLRSLALVPLASVEGQTFKQRSGCQPDCPVDEGPAAAKGARVLEILRPVVEEHERIDGRVESLAESLQHLLLAALIVVRHPHLDDEAIWLEPERSQQRARCAIRLVMPLEVLEASASAWHTRL